jgi:hypothetical protein
MNIDPPEEVQDIFLGTPVFQKLEVACILKAMALSLMDHHIIAK